MTTEFNLTYIWGFGIIIFYIMGVMILIGEYEYFFKEWIPKNKKKFWFIVLSYPLVSMLFIKFVYLFGRLVHDFFKVGY